jgi:hypothetical protein
MHRVISNKYQIRVNANNAESIVLNPARQCGNAGAGTINKCGDPQKLMSGGQATLCVATSL